MLVSATDPNHLLLSDFGIAKLYDMSHEPTFTNSAQIAAIGNDPALTNIGQIIGTADYMAPEQIEGRPVDGRTDVYALGVVLFQMLTGETPFRSTTVQGLYYQHVYTPPPGVRDVNPYVSEQLAWIVSKAMVKTPAARFQSAEEMAQALEEANRNATYQLQPPISQLPLVGQDTQGTVTMPSQQRPSSYGSQAALPNTGTASGFGAQIARPARRLRPFSYIVAGLVILLAVVLILARTALIPSGNGGGNTAAAQSFTETFQDNHLQWLSGSSGGLNATLNPNSYVLTIPQANPTNTYFPYPQNTGYLPANFTWAVKMEQTQGPTVLYGLAFRLTENGSAVSCYAFVIDIVGDYEVLKYNPHLPNSYVKMHQGSSSAIKQGRNQINVLQAKVQNDNFTFSINGTQINSSPITDSSDTSPYTGGEPALLVAGSSSAEVSFTATWAQLTVG
jgi:serine/threonine protein kinase